MRTGVAVMTLDTGRCPRWLFERMVRLGRAIATAVIAEFGSDEFIRRLADPVWFQSFGTVLAFDWNASGLTTTTTGALRVALEGLERDLGVFPCGGKGRASRRTPNEIHKWSEVGGLTMEQANRLEYASRASAKVDSALVQDGYQLYHHAFYFTKSGHWSVVQQGMNEQAATARRYHWAGDAETQFINEPHTGIASQRREQTVLDLTSKMSAENREVSWELVRNPKMLLHDLKIFERRQPTSPRVPFSISHEIEKGQFKVLTLADREFHHHAVENVNFLSPALRKKLDLLIGQQPGTFEQLMMTPSIGGKTIRALSLVAEVIYGAVPSYEDPARYSFAFGGKDGTPYPVDRRTYDRSLGIIEGAIRSAQLSFSERTKALRRAEATFGSRMF